jgi:hypothetical protein
VIATVSERPMTLRETLEVAANARAQRVADLTRRRDAALAEVASLNAEILAWAGAHEEILDHIEALEAAGPVREVA